MENDFNKDFKKLIDDIDNLIIEVYSKYDSDDECEKGYSTDDLQDIIIALVDNHIFTTEDSIQNLIYDLERLQDFYVESRDE